MKKLLPKRKKIDAWVLLNPVEDENSIKIHYSSKRYVDTFDKLSCRIENMTIEKKKHVGSTFMSSRKLRKVLDDLKLFKSGKFKQI